MDREQDSGGATRRWRSDTGVTFRNSSGATFEPSSVTERDANGRVGRDTLSRELDALLAKLQTPKGRSGMKAAFTASARQLGEAALASAR